MNRLFCFGLGFTAAALCRRLKAEGWAIAGTGQSERSVAEIAAQGFNALPFDGSAPGRGVPDALVRATHVLTSVPPDERGEPVLIHHGQDIAAAPHLRWIGYLSTVGVYGDANGGWVDEDSPTDPGLDRARRRLASEAHWQTLHLLSRRVVIFRLAGIYGPGRSALDTVRSGTARRIVKPGQVFNRIHVDDIATVLAASMAGAGSHGLYNVADDEPAPPQDVIAHAARLLGLAPPPEEDFAAARLSPMSASFYAKNQRVRNGRIKADLGVRLAYPDYHAGLAAIYRDGG
jgi:nucleoside-diphosphate-sugar epimerase